MAKRQRKYAKETVLDYFCGNIIQCASKCFLDKMSAYANDFWYDENYYQCIYFTEPNCARADILSKISSQNVTNIWKGTAFFVMFIKLNKMRI